MSEYNLIHGWYYRKDCKQCKGSGQIKQRLWDPPEQCDCGGVSEEEVYESKQAEKEAGRDMT